jgi:hypothetical protein
LISSNLDWAQVILNFPLFSSATLGKYLGLYLNQVMTASFQVLANSLLTNSLTNTRNAVSAPEKPTIRKSDI